MSRWTDLKRRFLAWTEAKAPPLHTFLTKDSPGYHTARTVTSLGLTALLLVAALWGGTGQALGDAPVVVIESGSMMHCTNGVGHVGDSCQSTGFGRLRTIDPGDLVFVRDTDGRSDVTPMAADGKHHHGKAGDVVVYRPDGSTARTPVIHRAMFWIEFHGDGTFSAPELGLDHVSSFDDPAISGAAARERFGITGFCQLRPVGSGPDDSGWITKGDNNPCWDQSGGSPVSAQAIRPDWLLGKARGEVPWVGLLKLFVFDVLGRSDNYAQAPGDLKGFMWTTVAAFIVVPWGTEVVLQRVRDRRKTDGPDE